MVRHIVLWKLKASGTGDSREAVFDVIKRALEAQRGRVPGLARIEAGLNFGASRHAADLALVSEFDSREALAAYHRHPAHLETRALVDPLVAEHWIVDYDA